MPTEGFRELAAKGTTTVKFRSRVRQSIHTQHVTFSAVSQGGARLSGLKNVEFVYPEASPERKQLLNL